MFNLNSILKEMKDVPANRLEELQQFVHALLPKAKLTESLRKKILSFGGAFADMSKKDYAEYVSETKKVRLKLFERKVEI